MKQFGDTPAHLHKRQLKKHGYTVLKDFFSVEERERFRLAGNAAFEGETQGCRDYSNDVARFIISDAVGVQLSNALWIGQHQSVAIEFISSIYSGVVAQDLASAYLGPRAIFGARLQLVHSRHLNPMPSVIPYVPHFDRVRTLKFYVYLNDVQRTGGHLYIGDTYWVDRSEAIRLKYKQAGYSYLKIPDDALKGYDGDFRKVEASVGDIVVFDSSQPHFHGAVHPGHERRVLILEVQSFDEVMYGYNTALQAGVSAIAVG
ncbi:hypothetical protein [Kordiimonas sp.]|uniref:hypothetical protein n=1 Tax=Kordiimonas sp. TaxID=1970157 RepID=UPI003A90ACF9